MTNRPSLLLLLPILLGRLPAQVPRLDDPALRAVDVVLVLDLLDADAQPVLGEDDVLLAHLLLGLRFDLAERQEDLVADPGEAREEGEGDDEGEDLAGGEGLAWKGEGGEWRWGTDLMAEGGAVVFDFPQAMAVDRDWLEEEEEDVIVE
jgi:hypothetical protein